MTNNLEDHVHSVLKKRFGFTSFRSGQKEAILSTLEGKDSLVMLPTGTGKSLCYQLPSYMLKGTTLIISPLLSLMEDQVEKMKRDGEKSVVALNSFMSKQEKRNVINQLGQFKFIFLSPEMIVQERMLNRLKHINISLLVIDEAHCISQWGMDFRPDYLKLGKVRTRLGKPLTMALTATAVEKVRDEIKENLGLQRNVKEIIYSVNRPTIQLRVEKCLGNKKERLLQVINELKGPGIIYFTSKKMADKTAGMIREQTSYQAESYHSDLEAKDKRKIQAQFLNNRLQIICATSAFGMGIDKSDIRFVIHYHLPANPEAYLQELGRSSRDKKGGVALLLYEEGDEYIQHRLQEDSLPTKDELLYCYRHPKMLSSLKEEPKIDISRYFIEQQIDFESAWASIQEHQSTKMYQLNYMVEYVRARSCKREFLLRYFNEDEPKKANGCCSNCHHDLELPYVPKEFKVNVNRNGQKQWKEVLKTLFNLKSKPI